MSDELTNEIRDLGNASMEYICELAVECKRLRQALERIAGEECYGACPYTLPERTKWFRDIAAAALSPKESPNG